MASDELTTKSEEAEPKSDENSSSLKRRSYLKYLAGTTTITAVIYGGESLSKDLFPNGLRQYGYGGVPIGVAAGAQVDTITESEPNDRKSAANEVGTGTTVSGTLSAGEVDWYTFETATTEDQSIVYERMSEDGVTVLVIYGSDGQFHDQLYVSATDPVEVSDVQVEGETFYVQIVDVEDGNGEYTLKNQVSTTDSTSTEQEPFGDQALTVPGRIPAEHFDKGGPDIAYHDETDGNVGDAYRSDESVDVETVEDITGDYNIGWIETGEWLEYTVDVTSGGYDLSLRVASSKGRGRLRVLLDGQHLGTIDVPDTGDWQVWTTVSLEELDLREGQQVFRLEAEEGGFNLNWIEFTHTEETTTPISDEFGVRGYGEYGFGGVAA